MLSSQYFSVPLWWFGAKIVCLQTEQHNIGTRLVFAGNILLQPAYVNLTDQNHEDFPIANNVVKNAFWLGVFPGLTEEMLLYVLEVTSEFIEQNK